MIKPIVEIVDGNMYGNEAVEFLIDNIDGYIVSNEQLRKIKADAVLEVAEMSFIDDAFTYEMIKAHANKLRNQND